MFFLKKVYNKRRINPLDHFAPAPDLPAATTILNQAIDYLLSKQLRAGLSLSEFCDSVAVTGEALFDFFECNFGPTWTTDFIGARTTSEDVERLDAHVLTHLRREFRRPSNGIKSLAKLYYEQWGPKNDGSDEDDESTENIHPRFPIGLRVMARSQHRSQCKLNDDYPDWYPGRIIGPGAIPNSYEILFDAKDEHGEDDRHLQTLPFLDGPHPRKQVMQGKQLGRGTIMIEEVRGSYTYDSKLASRKAQ